MKNRKTILIIAAFMVLLPLVTWADKAPAVGAVYAMTNSPDGNAVVVFERDWHGRLTPGNSYSTEGLGSGGGIDALVSQGALTLSANKRWLIGVNAGNNAIFVFRVKDHGLVLKDVVDSGGFFPTSVTVHRNLIYVLNAGTGANSPNVTGFQLNHQGKLKPIANSTRQLGSGGFHQVGFTPHGDALVITQGEPTGTNAIHVFGVDEDGLLDDSPTTTPSVGVVPFGFIFDWRGYLVVAEAGTGSVSSYELQDDNSLEVIDGAVANGNKATCWIAGTWMGAVYTANTGSDNLSLYSINPAYGQVTLEDAVAATGNKPIDMATTIDGRYLYVLNAGNGTVGAYGISPSGALKDLGAVTGLPPQYAQGIAVR